MFSQVTRRGRAFCLPAKLTCAVPVQLQDAGQAFLDGNADFDEERARWGLPAPTMTAQECVRDISRLVALAGPAVLALDQIETIKGSYREAVRGLNGLAETLKQAQREQKTSTKEIQSVRQTLRSLQSVRI